MKELISGPLLMRERIFRGPGLHESWAAPPFVNSIFKIKVLLFDMS
jgi:hypothetical protein